MTNGNVTIGSESAKHQTQCTVVKLMMAYLTLVIRDTTALRLDYVWISNYSTRLHRENELLYHLGHQWSLEHFEEYLVQGGYDYVYTL